MFESVPPELWAISGIILTAGLSAYATIRVASKRYKRSSGETAASIIEASGDVVALMRDQFNDFKERLEHLEEELEKSEKERRILIRWNSALLEQVLALGSVPVTLDDIRGWTDRA